MISVVVLVDLEEDGADLGRVAAAGAVSRDHLAVVVARTAQVAVDEIAKVERRSTAIGAEHRRASGRPLRRSRDRVEAGSSHRKGYL